MVATGVGEAVETRAKNQAIIKVNNNNLLNNDTPQSPSPFSPGQPLLTHSGHPWDNTSHKPQKHCPTNRPYSERAKTLDLNSLPERAKTLSSITPHEGVKTPCVQLVMIPVSTQENIKGLPLGGRLKWFIKEWERQVAHTCHLDLLRLGYRLPFREHPKLSRIPCIISSYSDVDKNNVLSTSIQNLLSKNAIEKVNREDSLGFYSRLFLVAKPGNRWRPVIDLSSLNQYLTVSKFKMETPESIRASLRQGEWVTSIDLSDAYLHLPIHPQSRKFLSFHHQGISYQFTSLPF